MSHITTAFLCSDSAGWLGWMCCTAPLPADRCNVSSPVCICAPPPPLLRCLLGSMKSSNRQYCRGRPLKQAIQECELRWFHETKAAAAEGEANQMALLGHMYTVGYGCKPDPQEATRWFAEASKVLGYDVLRDQPPIMHPTGPPELAQQAMHQEQQQQAQQQADAHKPQPQHRTRASSSSNYPTKRTLAQLGSSGHLQAAAASSGLA